MPHCSVLPQQWSYTRIARFATGLFKTVTGRGRDSLRNVQRSFKRLVCGLVLGVVPHEDLGAAEHANAFVYLGQLVLDLELAALDAGRVDADGERDQFTHEFFFA